MNRTLKWLLVAMLCISPLAIPVFATAGQDNFTLSYDQSHYTSVGWHQAGSDLFFWLTTDYDPLTRFEIQYEDREDHIWRQENWWKLETPFGDRWTTLHSTNYRFRTVNSAPGSGDVDYILQWDFYNEAR